VRRDVRVGSGMVSGGGGMRFARYLCEGRGVSKGVSWVRCVDVVSCLIKHFKGGTSYRALS